VSRTKEETVRNTVARFAAGRKWQASLGALSLCVLLTACGSSGSGDGASAAGGKKHLNIAFYEGSPSETSFVIGGWGALAAGKADGSTKVINDGPAQATPSSSVAFALNMAASAQADGFVMDNSFPEDKTIYPKLLRAAHKNVLVWQNAATSQPDEAVPEGATTFVGPNFVDLGQQTAKAAIEAAKLDGATSGTALIGNCVPGVPDLERMTASAKAEIKKLLPSVKVETFGTGLAQAANTAAWTSQIAKTRDLVFAFPVCGPDTQSLLVVKNRGIGGKFVAAGNAPTTPQQFQAIAEGKFSAGVAMNFWASGYISTSLAIDAARGKPFPKGYVNSGLLTITKDNANELGAAFRSQADAEKEFKPGADKILSDLSGTVKPMSALFEASAGGASGG
jgi:ABC-type sugar transport system substrate-binding protein